MKSQSANQALFCKAENLAAFTRPFYDLQMNFLKKSIL